MLFSLYPTITQHYFILCFITSLGVLQWVAAKNRYVRLSLLGPIALGWPGVVIGLLAVVVGFGWFFTTTPGLFREGLAGGELSTLFGAGCLTALLVTRLAGRFWLQVAHRKTV